ncbi:MAG: vanadium-dependent haloperoxidase [Pyrinomonadaceae bacterium]
MKKFFCLTSAISILSMMLVPVHANQRNLVNGTRNLTFTSDAVAREWNEIAFTTIGNPGPLPGARFMAIVQVAVFEAVNATTGKYEPYLGTVTSPPGASPEAAAIMAAHGVLSSLFPAQTANLDLRRDASLALIPDGPSKSDGIAVGMAAAAAMLADRMNDGSAPPLFHLPDNSDPYEWQVYPGCPVGGGAFKHWPNVRPFAIENASKFRAIPPPALRTGVYAQDYNEVQAVGDINSPNRPQDRTDVARLYAVSVPPSLWNLTLLQILSDRNDDISDTARIMALLNMTTSDAAVAVFESKYFYRTWRPITAIPRGDEDGNRWTIPSAFTPLIGTPCFPSYPSAHATISGASLKVLERAYGRFGHSITVTHPSLPGIEVTYSDLNTILEDISDARVYGGIHFRFDQTGGERQGDRIGNFVYNHMLKRR